MYKKNLSQSENCGKSMFRNCNGICIQFNWCIISSIPNTKGFAEREKKAWRKLHAARSTTWRHAQFHGILNRGPNGWNASSLRFSRRRSWRAPVKEFFLLLTPFKGPLTSGCLPYKRRKSEHRGCTHILFLVSGFCEQTHVFQLPFFLAGFLTQSA